MVFGISGDDFAPHQHRGTVLCSRRVVESGRRIIDAERAIRVSHDNRHIAHALGLQGGRKIGERLTGNVQEVVPKRQIFDGVSRESEFSRQDHLSAVVIGLCGELEKALDIVRPVAHYRVSLG